MCYKTIILSHFKIGGERNAKLYLFRQRRQQMTKYIIRRILHIIPVLFIIGIIGFILVHLAPGNEAQVILGSQATPAEIANYSKYLGENKPIYDQLWHWLLMLLRGNLGYSLIYQESVSRVIGAHIMPTLWLSVLSTLVTLLVVFPLAILSVRFKGSPIDGLLMLGGLSAASLPSFWFGIVAIIIASVTFHWLPASGYVGISSGINPWAKHLILPVLTLCLLQGAIIFRMLRDSMIEAMRSSYIRTARSKGLTPMQIILRHALPNALIPVITVIGLSFATLLSGAIVVEVVFNIPGLGYLTVQAVSNRDYPVVVGVTLFIGLVYVIVNLLTDLLYYLADPRIKRGSA